MKNMFRFSALLCAMAVLVTSCTKDETLEPQREPIAAGDEIISVLAPVLRIRVIRERYMATTPSRMASAPSRPSTG